MSAVCTRLSVTEAEVFVLSGLSLEITVNMQYNDKKQEKTTESSLDSFLKLKLNRNHDDHTMINNYNKNKIKFSDIFSFEIKKILQRYIRYARVFIVIIV